MIQIYVPENTNYRKNGDAVLHPEVCRLTMSLKGEWEMEIENPPDENINLIKKESVIRTDTPIGKDQLFRIYEYEKSEDGVRAFARPIFFDAAKEVVLIDRRPTNVTGNRALQLMMEGTKYSAESDILTINTAYYIRKNLIEAINGSDENSFINRWGGEPIYKNKHLIMNRRIGGDYGAKAVFGHNLQSIKETINMENVATRIIPVAYNGYTLEGEKPWVDSHNIEKYAIIYTKIIEYSDVKLKEDASGNDEKSFATLKELREELVKRVKQEYEKGIDMPEVSYSISIVDLEGTIEYQDIEQLVKVGIGDTVHAENRELDITTKNRCIKLVYDCILQKNESIELGDTKTDYFDKMTAVRKNIEESIDQNGIKADKVYGVMDLVKTRMRATAEGAIKQADKAILFEDLDEASETYGAMAIGTTGMMIAWERTPDKRDWDWRTFGTGKGFLADYFVGGVLLSQNYEDGKTGFKLDLNDGIMETAQLLIKSFEQGQMEKGFLFEDGKLKMIGPDEETEAEIFFDYDIPDLEEDPNGIPGGFRDVVIRTTKRGQNGEYAAIRLRGTDGRMEIHFSELELGGGTVNYNCKNFNINEKGTKTGRAEFSNGTFLEFENGMLIGGSTKEGAF